MQKSVWTKELVLRLIALRTKGKSCGEIAEILGAFSRSAVIGKLNRLGFSVPVPKDKPKIANARRSVASRFHHARKRIQKPSGSIPKGPAKVPDHRPLRTETIATPDKLKPLLDLGPHDCRWPVGDPREKGFGFCGAHRVEGLAYCPDHVRIAYNLDAASKNVRRRKKLKSLRLVPA